MQKIGNVNLNYDYYSGMDEYSDGDIEDVMLSMSENMTEKEIRSNLERDRNISWPLFYHFSQDRENILSWYPFDEKKDILEIGSGCGAITGSLCKASKSVTCIELSKRRSLINANRHREFSNLEIIVGNFYDIASKLNTKYDYITLIGVFEYSKLYIPTDNPYVDFLNMLKNLLKPGGKIFIAIENRFGLKYFAGCREDHSGVLFDGLEGYCSSNVAKTFSKSEWENLLKNNGFNDYYFYYPYPDYKLPLAIYSQDYLPSGTDLVHNHLNFDRDRYSLFDEDSVWKSMDGTKDFEFFSNSFLIEITGE